MNPSDIVYESGRYFIRRIPKGYEVYRMGITHAERCATIGYMGQVGLDRAKAEINRRQTTEVDE